MIGFAVCGATLLGGAERMRDALNEYFGNMIDMLTGHGADIVKFAGKARCGASPGLTYFPRQPLLEEGK